MNNMYKTTLPKLILKQHCFLPIVILFLFFMRSIVFYVDIVKPVGIEECHTGAIAKQILEHGIQFPLKNYTPIYYENSIIIEGLLTVISARILGLNQLSLEIVPLLFSFATLMMFRSMLIKAGYEKGSWFFTISYFFGSMYWYFLTMESVGNHTIGLFVGTLILFLFFNGYLNISPNYYYGMMFVLGIGLFAHLGSMLYAGLCFMLFLFFKTKKRAGPRLSALVAFKCFLFFLFGALPFFYFLFNTSYSSITSLLYILSDRSSDVSNWFVYSERAFAQFLFQFDEQRWRAVFFLFFVFVFWLQRRFALNKEFSIGARLLNHIALYFQLPIFIAVVLFSGGEFTTYYMYLLPFIYLSGAIVMSRWLDRFSSRRRLLLTIQSVLSVSLVILLSSGPHAANMNFSIRHALRKLTANDDSYFCYWKFGSAFGNYLSIAGDSKDYAERIVSACAKLGAPEKSNECIWGFSSMKKNGFTIDEDTVYMLDPSIAELFARSIGGWSDSISPCLELQEAYVDDCILGHIERKAVFLYSISPPRSSYLRIPCLPQKPNFSGLVENIRDRIRDGDIRKGPQACPDIFKDIHVQTSVNVLCVQADAYCATVEKQMDFCDKSYTNPDDINMCRFIFENVWMAKEAEAKM